jgi:hypothetical protein
MKWVLVFVANEFYIERAIQTIQQARSIGEWKEDIVILGPSTLLQYEFCKKSFIELNITFVTIPYHHVSSLDSFWNNHKEEKNYEYILCHPYIFQKFFVFHSFFKAWHIVFYMDSGCVIQGSLERMKESCTPRHFLYAHSDAYPFYNRRSLDCQFHLDLVDKETKEEMESKYNLDIDYFQSTLLIYNTKILEENTVNRLFELTEKYPFSYRMDQGIMNLYWTCERRLWRQIPLQDEKGFLYNFLEINQCKTKDYLILKYPRYII